MSQDQYLKFVQALANDLNSNKIGLPSFPAVVMRIRTALNDPETTGDDIGNILGNDAVLASRVLILANSTFHNPAGIKIESLVSAVGRIGFEKVRTAAISYAVEQLHSSKGLEPLKNELRTTWTGGLRLAAMSEVIARQCTELDSDSAFVVGLLHRIGVLYIFSKYAEYPVLLKDPDSRQHLIDEWTAPIGESIVSNWQFSEEIQATLNPDEVETTHRRCTANLVDIVTMAKKSLDDQDSQWHDTAEAKRLQLTAEKMPAIMEEYQVRLESLASVVR